MGEKEKSTNENLGNVITLTKPWVSLQTDSKGVPLVDMKIGDVITLKEDGIYFERKLDCGVPTQCPKSLFESFKLHS